jgi:hypothetical protein
VSAADQAREKLAAVEREADEIAKNFPDGLPQFMATSFADRWQSSIAAAQALATLEIADRLAAVVGLLEVLAAPAQPLRLVKDAQVEWQWWQDAGEMGGEWVAAASEADADELSARHYCQYPDDHNARVRSRVVGPWTERPAR